MNEAGTEILNKPPRRFESTKPLKSGKNYRFTVKNNNKDEDEIIFLLNGKERSRKIYEK